MQALKFWIIIKPETTRRKIKRDFPPSFSFAKFALRPIEIKNISIKLVWSSLLVVILYPQKLYTKVEIVAATRPPATGSGILYFLKNSILFTKNLPISKTITAAINV